MINMVGSRSSKCQHKRLKCKEKSIWQNKKYKMCVSACGCAHVHVYAMCVRACLCVHMCTLYLEVGDACLCYFVGRFEL
jgi:hypothetical protein